MLARSALVSPNFATLHENEMLRPDEIVIPGLFKWRSCRGAQKLLRPLLKAGYRLVVFSQGG